MFLLAAVCPVIIHRRVGLNSPKTQNSFLLTVLFYNISAILSVTLDFVYYVLSDIIKDNVLFIGFQRSISVLFLVSFLLWTLYFINSVYLFLDKPIDFKTKPWFKKSLIGVIVFFVILMVIRHSELPIIIYKNIFSLFSLLCLFTVSSYSAYLFIKLKNTTNTHLKTALRVLSILLFIHSISFTFLWLGEYFSFLSRYKPDMIIYPLVHISFNLFILIWVFMFMDSLKTSVEPVVINSQSLDELAEKYQISKREIDIINLLSSGKSNQEIADALFISVGTVKTHLHNIYTKIGIKNRTQLAKLF